jgi:hypothetical protein
MARGWESKSVEEQMARTEQARTAHAVHTYQAGEAKRAADGDRVRRERERQTLQMQRENILSQRTSNPARRAALEAALTQIEAQLAELG